MGVLVKTRLFKNIMIILAISTTFILLHINAFAEVDRYGNEIEWNTLDNTSNEDNELEDEMSDKNVINDKESDSTSPIANNNVADNASSTISEGNSEKDVYDNESIDGVDKDVSSTETETIQEEYQSTENNEQSSNLQNNIVYSEDTKKAFSKDNVFLVIAIVVICILTIVIIIYIRKRSRYHLNRS